VRYLDLSPVIAAAVKPDQWLFVDRIHFTDDGYDFVAGLLADSLGLS
jgi:lysophospholipase L1-like esterase